MLPHFGGEAKRIEWEKGKKGDLYSWNGGHVYTWVSCKLGSNTMLMVEFANVAMFVVSISCKNQLIIRIRG